MAPAREDSESFPQDVNTTEREAAAQGGGADTGEPRQPTWLEQSEARDEEPGRPLRPQALAGRPPRAEVTDEPPGPAGPPDLAHYDRSDDAFFQDKIPGAQAREDYAKSL